MKIAVLGNGVEGKSIQKYFEAKGDKIEIFDEKGGVNFEDLDFGGFDLVFRSPSVAPRRINSDKLTSSTRYFFEKCPAKIIGVTATKGKGTICSMMESILGGKNKVWLVGNIGNPALDVLDEIEASDVVIFELSSFQLWDLKQSPATAVVGRIEPDHLNVHEDMDDYVAAKWNIVKYQGEEDKVIYFAENELSRKIGESAIGEKISYPSACGAHVEDDWFCFGGEKICEKNALKLPGEHNVENALAAISVCVDLVESEDIKVGLENFKGLPHRLELIREIDGVRYYDDNFSSATPATKVAVEAFAEPVVLIAGGYDRGLEYGDFVEFLNAQDNLKKIILMGQTAERMSQGLNKDYEIVGDIYEAISRAKDVAEKGDVVVMSPGAASFDMFDNFKHRAEVYTKIVKEME